MLVLTRKLNEQIQIGNDITITVVRVKGNTVRVGIEAPRDVRVVRAELPKNGTGETDPQAAESGEDAAAPRSAASAADASEDGDARVASRDPLNRASGPLAQAVRNKPARKSSSQNQFTQRHAAHGDATSDDAIGSLRLKPRRRAPGEKPAVLPRLPRLGPASFNTNRLAVYDQVRILLE